MNNSIIHLDRHTWNDIYECLKKGMSVDSTERKLRNLDVSREEILYVVGKLKYGVAVS